MKVVILCGGLGTRLREETEYRPKPMVPVGDRPILWHIMNRYAIYGYNEFILCLGYKGDMIKNYFLHYRTETSDFTLKLGCKSQEAIQYHSPCHERNWIITFVDTGERTMTGARVKQIERYIDGETFLLTYGDGLADLDIMALTHFHERHGRVGTVTSVRPGIGRFGELVLETDRVTQFMEKPEKRDGYISGGFFVFHRDVFRYLSDDENCVLEREPLQRLSADGQLMAYRHHGYWECMDTYRDYQHLNELWNKGEPPWAVVAVTPTTERKRRPQTRYQTTIAR